MIKINFHINEVCNYCCKYCFRDKSIFTIKGIYKQVLDNLKESGLVEVVNIVGGEPTYNKELLLEILNYCKQIGLKTTIVTNGLRLARDNEFLQEVCKYVECIGVSIDSFDTNINLQLGRHDRNNDTLTYQDVKLLNETIEYALSGKQIQPIIRSPL